MITTNNNDLILDIDYVVRHLLLGLVFYWVVYSVFLSDLSINSMIALALNVYFIACVALLPIAKYTVDKFVDFAMGGSVLFFNVFFGLFCSFIIWSFAPFIAPFILVGVLYRKIKARV